MSIVWEIIGQKQLCGKFGHLVHRRFHRFNVHFTGVTDSAYSSTPSPSVNLSSAQWDDSSDDVSAYKTSSYPADIPPHSTSQTSGVQQHIPAVYPYMYHLSAPKIYHVPYHALTPASMPGHYVLHSPTNVTTIGSYVPCVSSCLSKWTLCCSAKHSTTS